MIIRPNQTLTWVVTKILCKRVAAGNRREEHCQLSNDTGGLDYFQPHLASLNAMSITGCNILPVFYSAFSH